VRAIGLTILGLALYQVRQFAQAITHQDASAIYHQTCDEHLERIALGGLHAAKPRTGPSATPRGYRLLLWSAVVNVNGIIGHSIRQ
jgi:hypothetical protein